jgi:hypothetical protein
MSLNVVRCTSSDFQDFTPEVGQVVCIKDNDEGPGRLVMWSGTEWNDIKADVNSEIQMTAYDINKQVINQLPALEEEEITTKKIDIGQFVTNTNNEYYMLLCREKNYYTLCHRVLGMNPSPADNVRQYSEWPNELITTEDLIIECAKCLGEIKSIELVDGAVEIWVTDPFDTYVMYFFPYDGGVEACQ